MKYFDCWPLIRKKNYDRVKSPRYHMILYCTFNRESCMCMIKNILCSLLWYMVQPYFYRVRVYVSLFVSVRNRDFNRQLSICVYLLVDGSPTYLNHGSCSAIPIDRYSRVESGWVTELFIAPVVQLAKYVIFCAQSGRCAHHQHRIDHCQSVLCDLHYLSATWQFFVNPDDSFGRMVKINNKMEREREGNHEASF